MVKADTKSPPSLMSFLTTFGLEVAPLACARRVQWLASLAAMFAGKPPSSSDPMKTVFALENQVSS